MKRAVIVLMFFISIPCLAQETWYGEIAFYTGGGVNDVFRVNELDGAPSFSGDGFFTGGLSVRRMVHSWFSVETGINFSSQRYIMHSAPLPESDSSKGRFGMFSLPVKARFDFLKYMFTDAGISADFQAGPNRFSGLSGIGLTAGLGAKYKFKSDLIVTVRAYGSQLALIHFSQKDHPYTLFNSGVTLGVGYQFIKLGKCHCPGGKTPGRKFF
jgi:hypothetical protein